MIVNEVSYQTLKDFTLARGLSVQAYVEDGMYVLFVIDGQLSLKTRVRKSADDPSAEQLDYEATLAPGSNRPLDPPRDSDNMTISRNKVTKTGWTFNRANLKFETSKPGLRYKTVALVDLPGVTLKLFNAAGTDITAEAQSVLDTDCVKTQLDFEPPYNNEIIAGSLVLLTPPVGEMFLWVIGVPDVPAAYGGSKEFVTGEALHMLGPKQILEIDGRTSKPLTYSAVYHTNKIRATIRHDVGEKVKMQMTYQQFKA